jgi:hypothetical protein
MRPIDAVAIKLTRADSRHKDMPVMGGALNRRVQRNDACRLSVIRMVKEDYFKSRGIGREDAEVGSFGTDCRAEGIRTAYMHLLRRRSFRMGGVWTGSHALLRQSEG